MEQNFKEILASMLADLDKGKSVDEIIAAQMKEANLSAESQSRVEDAVGLVDKLKTAREYLAVAKSKGASRQEWLEAKTENAIEALPEELQDKAKAVLDKANKEYFENAANE